MDYTQFAEQWKRDDQMNYLPRTEDDGYFDDARPRRNGARRTMDQYITIVTDGAVNKGDLADTFERLAEKEEKKMKKMYHKMEKRINKINKLVKYNITSEKLLKYIPLSLQRDLQSVSKDEAMRRVVQYYDNTFFQGAQDIDTYRKLEMLVRHLSVKESGGDAHDDSWRFTKSP